MATVTEAKSAVNSYLSEMGLSPSSLKIISFDSEKDDRYWLLEGKFQEGFMGSYYEFSAKFDPLTRNVSKMDVKEATESTEGYA